MKIPEHIEKRIKWAKLPKNEIEAYRTIAGFEPIPKPCDDCGRASTSNRCVSSQFMLTPMPHWKHGCTQCRRYKNPITNEWDLNNVNYRSKLKELNQEKDK